MDSAFAEDAFFDYDEEDHGANLKGEYNRGTTPPSHRSHNKLIGNPSAGSSTTSGHYSSDSNMSKTKESQSKDTLDLSYSRSGSPPLHTRTPSGSSYRYSDSFDSEASGDSGSRSPGARKSRRGGRKKHGGDAGKRFDSATSRDSRASSLRSTTNSSVYGRTNRKAPQKPQQKKGKGRGRAGSNASSAQNTPRAGNANETTRRILSAKGHTINRLRNEFEVLKSKHDDLQREFKLQKELHRKNTRMLDRYEKSEESLPSVMKAQNSELEHYRKKCRGYRERERHKDQQLKQYNEKLNRTEDELKRARNILEDKGLKERAELQKERDGLEESLQEKERKLEDLEKYLSNVKKNQRHERRDWKSNEREFRGQMEHLTMENERLQLQLRDRIKELDVRNIYSNRTLPMPSRRLRLSHSPVTLLQMMFHSPKGEFREKEKELDIKNIYSNRIVKPPAGRLRTTSMSPNSLRPIMIHKTTTTDEIKLSPKAPMETRRSSSADERTPLDTSRFKSPREERYKKQAEDHRQKSRERDEPEEEVVENKEEKKKELSEHEHILMDLGSGTKKPEERTPSKAEEEDDDETTRILRQFDDYSLVKGNSHRKPTDEDRRREEERRRDEERRKIEEEEKRRKEDENKKPKWLKGPTTNTNTATTTSSNMSSSTGYTPSAFSSNAAPMHGPPAAAAREVIGQSQQHKAVTSKLPWLANQSPVHKPEQDRKEKEEREAKLSNGAPTHNTEDEEDYPFFGSKPANNTKPAPKAAEKQPYAVNSVKDLQKYSTTKETNTTGNDDDYNGLFAKPAATNTTYEDGRSAKEKEEQEAKEAEERRNKDLLLARMQDIDDGKKPDSGRSRKVYNHTDPVKNMHNGKPSHPENGQERRKSIDDLTFGAYAPSFTTGATKPAAKGPAKKKNPFFDNDNDSDSGFKLSPKHSPHRTAKKNNLMSDLFGSGSEKSDNPSRSSFGEDNVFSSSTKAKPVADSGVYPWEKKVNAGQENGGSNKPNNRGMPPQKSFSDDFDDDIEEMTL